MRQVILPAIMARRRPRWRAPAEADSHRSQAACSPFRRQTLANSGETAISLIVLCLFAGFASIVLGLIAVQVGAILLRPKVVSRLPFPHARAYRQSGWTWTVMGPAQVAGCLGHCTAQHR